MDFSWLTLYGSKILGPNQTDPEVDAAIGDAGYSVKDFSTADYMKMIRAFGQGDSFSILTGKDGKPTVKTSDVPGGTEANTESTCPDWMPAQLCSGYNKIVSNLPNAPNAASVLASGARMVGMDDLANKIEEYGIRITIILIGLILVAIGIYFALKEPINKAASGVAGTALKAVL